MTSYDRTLAIDIETFSDLKLGDVGVYKYTDSPAFDILLFAYAYDDEPVQIIDLTKGKMPKELVRDLYDGKVLKTAFNAAFERVCLNRYLNGITGPWECTMVRAWELGISGSLAVVGNRLGLSEEERKINGSRLIQLFCQPRKPSKANPETRWTAETKPEEWGYFVEYCKRDVEAERAIRKKLLQLPIFPKELALYKLDQDINDRGVRIDMDFARAAKKDIRRCNGKSRRTRCSTHGDTQPTASSSAQAMDPVADWRNGRVDSQGKRCRIDGAV